MFLDVVYKRWSKSCTLPTSNSHLVKAQLTLLMIVDSDLVSGVCCQVGIRCHFTVCCQVPIYSVKGLPLMKWLDRAGWRWYFFLQSRPPLFPSILVYQEKSANGALGSGSSRINEFGWKKERDAWMYLYIAELGEMMWWWDLLTVGLLEPSKSCTFFVPLKFSLFIF
jgi:hypothetical protein